MKDIFKKLDKPLFILMIIYTVLGLVMIFSSSSITAVLYNRLDSSYFFNKQLIFVVVSWILCVFIVLKIPTSKYKVLAPLGLFAILCALGFLIPYGHISKGAKSWYDLGFFKFQPSEFFKSVMILYLGVQLERLITKKKVALGNIMIPFIIVAAACGFIVFQPDFGTAVIIAGIAGFTFLVIPSFNKEIKIMKIAGIISVFAVILLLITGVGNLLNAEQVSRLNYKQPCTRYTEDTGYQVCNGYIAMNNGGLLGSGLGNSTQKYLYLPEAHTDFIFPIVVEELGSLVGAFIILGYLLMLLRILKIAKESNTIRGAYIAYGTFLYILLHLIINLMGVLALIPLTGVPLPFLSYGGSFYVNLIFILFVNQRIAIETKNNKTKELIRSLS